MAMTSAEAIPGSAATSVGSKTVGVKDIFGEGTPVASVVNPTQPDVPRVEVDETGRRARPYEPPSDQVPAQDPAKESTRETSGVYLAFSGGGWNSHSFLAGMVAGALDAYSREKGNRSLNALFKNVDGISANSGGAWFLTQLAYSKRFRDAFQSLRSTNNYNSTGFNGQTRALFGPAIPGHVIASSISLAIKQKLQAALGPLAPDNAVDTIVSVLQSSGALEAIQLLGPGAVSTGFDWPKFVEQYVYAPYGIYDEIKNLTLGSQRNDWASSKKLIIASAVQSKPAMIQRRGGSYVLTKANSTIPNNDAFALPLSFVSSGTSASASSAYTLEMVASRRVPAPLSLDHVQTDLSGEVESRITDNLIGFDGSLRDRVRARSVGVIEAAIASSSFAAAAATPSIYPRVSIDSSLYSFSTDKIAYALADILKKMSPSVEFESLDIESSGFYGSGGTARQAINRVNQKKAARLADGGYADNTSVANVLRHIQDVEGVVAPFEITLFMNTDSDPLTGIRMRTDAKGGLTSFLLPADVTALFGNKNGSHTDGLTVASLVPGSSRSVSPRVFKDDAFYTRSGVRVEPRFVYNAAHVGIQIQGYRLRVETVSNRSFGIAGGQKGFVNLFVASNKKSLAGPKTNAILDAYDNNFTYYRDAIANQSNGSGYGYPFLKEAFDLVPDFKGE